MTHIEWSSGNKTKKRKSVCLPSVIVGSTFCSFSGRSISFEIGTLYLDCVSSGYSSTRALFASPKKTHTKSCCCLRAKKYLCVRVFHSSVAYRISLDNIGNSFIVYLCHHVINKGVRGKKKKRRRKQEQEQQQQWRGESSLLIMHAYYGGEITFCCLRFSLSPGLKWMLASNWLSLQTLSLALSNVWLFLSGTNVCLLSVKSSPSFSLFLRCSLPN